MSPVKNSGLNSGVYRGCRRIVHNPNTFHRGIDISLSFMSQYSLTYRDFCMKGLFILTHCMNGRPTGTRSTNYKTRNQKNRYFTHIFHMEKGVHQHLSVFIYVHLQDVIPERMISKSHVQSITILISVPSTFNLLPYQFFVSLVCLLLSCLTGSYKPEDQRRCQDW